MFSHSKLLAISCLWLVSAVMLPTAQASLSELKAQLASRSTIESKQDFLKTALPGQRLEVKAALGADLIASAPANTQLQVARNVAQILASLKDSPSDTPKLIGMLTHKLPANLAPSLAGAIAIGAGNSEPQSLARITAAVIVAQSSTIDHAGTIAEEVTASAPLSSASVIASAIGAAFADNPQLANKAPEIAADITRAILSKQGTVDQLRREIADSVAALTVLLPGSVRSNQNLIVSIGKAVAAVISSTQPGMATTIVGITSAALKSAAGTADIAPVLDGFTDAFKDSINDPIIQAKLDKVVSDINLGASDKTIKPLETLPPSTDPLPPPSAPPGPITSPETNVVNH